MGQAKILRNSFIPAMLLSVALISGFLLIWEKLAENNRSAFDRVIVELIRSFETASLTAVMKGFTTIGSGVPVIVISIAFIGLLGLLGYRRELYFYAAVIAGSGLLNWLLKQLFHRARPVVHRIVEANGYSFPSGHSMSAFTLYGITIYFLWKHIRHPVYRAAAVAAGTVVVLMIGISRIYLGVHYPSDVLGGYLISGAWLTASITSYRYFLDRRRRLVKGLQ